VSWNRPPRSPIAWFRLPVRVDQMTL